MQAEVHELTLEGDRFRYHVTPDLLPGEEASSLDLLGVVLVVAWETVRGRLAAHNAGTMDGRRLLASPAGEGAEFQAGSDLGTGLLLAGAAGPVGSDGIRCVTALAHRLKGPGRVSIRL